MDSDSRFVVTPRTVMGLSIAALGVVLTLDRLGVAHVDHLFRRFWPVPIMIMGGLMLVQATDGRERMRGIVFSIIGTWLFLNMQGLITIRLWELFWPAILILIGVSMVLRRGGRPQWRREMHERMRGAREARWAARHPPTGGGSAMGFDASRSADSPSDRAASAADSSERVSMFAVLSGTRRATASAAFAGGDITAIMGGAQLDLRLAAIPAGQDAVLDVTSVMGGVEIFVPPHWEVATPVMPLLGAVEDERLPPIQTDGAANRVAGGRLVLRGFVLMGGVHIKS